MPKYTHEVKFTIQSDEAEWSPVMPNGRLKYLAVAPGYHGLFVPGDAEIATTENPQFPDGTILVSRDGTLIEAKREGVWHWVAIDGPARERTWVRDLWTDASAAGMIASGRYTLVFTPTAEKGENE